MFPAFAHFRRTATRDTESERPAINEGDKVVMWYASSNRDETRFEDPDRFDITATPTTRPSARWPPLLPRHRPGAPGAEGHDRGDPRALPAIELAGEPSVVESLFRNQLKTLPVRLAP